jgi:hypothetical protein
MCKTFTKWATALAVATVLVLTNGLAQASQPLPDRVDQPEAPLLQLSPPRGDTDFVKLKLTKPDGTPILFNRTAIIAFHESVSGVADARARTEIRVEDTSFFVRETPAELAAVFKSFVVFTRAGGAPLWINPGQVITVHEPSNGYAHSQAHSEIHVHERSYFVRETVEQVEAILTP